MTVVGSSHTHSLTHVPHSMLEALSSLCSHVSDMLLQASFSDHGCLSQRWIRVGIVSGCTRTFEHHGAVHKRSRGTSVKHLYAKSRGYSRLDFRISLCEAHSMSAGHAELKTERPEVSPSPTNETNYGS